MDVITYGVLIGKVKKSEADSEAVKSLVESFPSGYTFKGTVASTTDLPNTAEVGDLYIVTGEENSEYVWDGTQFLNRTPIISHAQIDDLY